MSGSLAIYAVSGIIAISLLVVYRAALPKLIPGIPCNKGASKSIFGDVAAVQKHITETSEVWTWVRDETMKMNSPVIQLFMRPFGRPWVIVTDPREAHDVVLRRTPQEFDRSKFFGDILGEIMPLHHVSLPTGDRFREQRRLVDQTMSTQFLNDVAAHRIYESTVLVIQMWSEKCRLARGHPFRANEDILVAALDTVLSATFGQTTGALKTRIDLLSSLNDVALPKDQDTEADIPRAPYPEIFESLTGLADSCERLRRAVKVKNGFILDALRNAGKKLATLTDDHEAIKCAMDLVVQREMQNARKESRQPKWDSAVIQDELFGFMVAGNETTATTLGWGMKFLTDFPEVQNELRSALRAAFDDENPSVNDFVKKRVPYLDAVVAEISRLSHVVPALHRVAVVDTQVLGYLVPKGTDVFFINNGPGYVLPAMSIEEKKRSPSSQESKNKIAVWNDGDSGIFAPKRWLVSDDKGRVDFDPKAGPLHVFGAGIRGCFGRRMAELQMRIFIAMVIWNFELQPTPPSLSTGKAVDMITRHPQQCYVRLTAARW